VEPEDILAQVAKVEMIMRLLAILGVAAAAAAAGLLEMQPILIIFLVLEVELDSMERGHQA
jgi:hypothetical protein